MGYDERYEVRNPEIEDVLRRIAARIDESVPEGFAFGLFLMPFGAKPIEEGGAVFWISNAERDGMVDAIKGWIEDSERRKAERAK